MMPTPENTDRQSAPRADHSEGQTDSGKHYVRAAHDWLWSWTLRVLRWLGNLMMSPQFWTAAATVIIAAATVFYAVYAKRQWNAMDGQLAAMRGQLAEMQKQTVINRQQLVGSQAAVLDLGFGLSGVGGLSIGLNNSGHVNASGIYFQMEARKESLPNEMPTGAPILFSLSIPPIQPGRGFSHTWLLPWRFKELGEPGKWPNRWPGNVTYVFRGKLSYDDGFGNTISRSVCQEWLPQFSIQYKAQGSGGGGLYPCSDIQTAIHSTLEQEKKAENGAERPN